MSAILELKGISKYFSGHVVLDDVHLQFQSGELHALVGENGAGKSTMIKIISGVYRADAGNVLLKGKPVRFLTPTDAQCAGISTMFQETQEIPEMSVAENIYLGRELKSGMLVNRKRMLIEAQALVDHLGLHIHVENKMSSLAVSQRKMVELARAYMQESTVVIMDEPTANLNAEETDILFRIIDDMKSRGTTIIYISHRMQEVFSLSDRVSVLRDGRLISTLERDQYDVNSLISLMIGRALSDMYPERKHQLSEPMLKVEHLTLGDFFQDVSFEVRAGEIVGLSGLDASGANAIAKAIFGLSEPPKGSVTCNGKTLSMRNPADSIANHLAFLPEDRKTQGLFLDQDMVTNTTVSALRGKFSRHGFLRRKLERSETADMMKRVRVKANGMHTRPEELSGGNQQKVLLGRWMADRYDVLMMEEPTRGVDVGAKSEIYTLMNQMVENGMALMIYSTEMLELLGMCDRILVFSQGKITACLPREEATQELIMQHALVR